MRFSYKILKNLVPAARSKKDLIEKLNWYLFEAEDAGGDAVEIKILPNRYADAACYLGFARELAAIYGTKFNSHTATRMSAAYVNQSKSSFDVRIKTKNCRRIVAQYFDNIKIWFSPAWLVTALEASGIRSINNLVDITNYVTLETGQPLHAFDFDKIHPPTGSGRVALIVRQAINEEPIELLSGEKLHLTREDMVIADTVGALDIAGIKGAKKAEITEKTTRILLTAANFEPTSIYRTSRRLGITTDASVRFSHGLSPELIPLGIGRAARLVIELCGGSAGGTMDVYPKKLPKRVIKFDLAQFNSLTGLQFKSGDAFGYLKRLDFGIKGRMIEAPAVRLDIERFDDLVEEVVRLYGYNNLPSTPPHIQLRPAAAEDQIVFGDKVRRILVNFGLTEVYNYSFAPRGALVLKNPVVENKQYLRSQLADGLRKNLEDNLRFFDRVAIFEIGKVFNPEEKLVLGMGLVEKKKPSVRELKGTIEGLLEKIGLTDYLVTYDVTRMKIEVDGAIIGYIEDQIAEIDLEKLLNLAQGEREFRPLSKYPAVDRDISLIVPADVRIGKILETIEPAQAPHLQDVDLVDEYETEAGEQSITLRLVFEAADRTLTDEEVNKELEKIKRILEERLGVEIR